MQHNYKSNYENVQLRQLQVADLELLRQWRNNPDNTRFLSEIPYITKDMQRIWYENYLADKDEMAFAIVENMHLNRLVGSLSLYNFDEKKAEFGKILIGDKEAHGKRIGTNALIAVLILAFNTFEMEEIYLHVYTDNFAAIRSYERAGLKVIKRQETNGNTEYIMSIKRLIFKRHMRKIYNR